MPRNRNAQHSISAEGVVIGALFISLIALRIGEWCLARHSGAADSDTAAPLFSNIHYRALYALLTALTISIVWTGMEKEKRWLFGAAFVALHCLILYQAVVLSKDVIYGGDASRRLFILPRYGFARIPESPSATRYAAVDRPSADFAAVYFTSQDPSSFEDAYYPEKTLDPWQRPSRSAPLIHFICSLTFCRLKYGYACFSQFISQTLLFFCGFWLAFRALGVKKCLLPSLLLANVCLFLTPVGLSWYERGQFSLYLGLSYLWLLLGLIKGKRVYVIVSALFAFIKWLSLPCSGVILAAYVMDARGARQFKERLATAAMFPLTVVILWLLFPGDGIHFLKGLCFQELHFGPYGVSLVKVAPRYAVKLLPVGLIAAGYMNIRKSQNGFGRLIPYFVGSAILLLTYPTLAWEYGLPSLLGFVPFVVYWALLPEVRGRVEGHVIKYGFFLFLIGGSFSFCVSEFYLEWVLIALYWGAGIVFVFAPYVLSRRMHMSAGGGREAR